MKVKPFFDLATSTLTYLIWDATSRDAIVVDPVLDFDPAASQVSFTSIQILEREIRALGLTPRWIIETHAHADHFSGAQYLKTIFPTARIGIGERIRSVQATFQGIFGLGSDFKTDGSQFDHLFHHGEKVEMGELSFEVRFTPGHTPACSSFYFEASGHCFTGDALFLPDLGTGRCDFPSGSAAELYRSVTEQLYSLPDDVEVHPGHDYPPNTRSMEWKSTIGEEKRSNAHLRGDTTKSQYVEFRTTRDKSLSPPRLLYPSLRVNIEGGKLPTAADGQAYLKLPLFVKHTA